MYNYQKIRMDLPVKLGWNFVAINFYQGAGANQMKFQGFVDHQEQSRSKSEMYQVHDRWYDDDRFQTTIGAAIWYYNDTYWL